MRLTGLNFEAVPSLSIPFRFYLTAPFFAVLASLLMIEQGDIIWISRWIPASLAITHLLALGVMAMIMIGSLFQVMPVLCGSPIKMGKVPLFMMHGGFICGTLSLSAGFLGWIDFEIGFILLALSLGYFVIKLIGILVFSASGEQTRVPILIAVIALSIVLIAGLMLLAGYLWHWQITADKDLTNLHASVGLFGWILLLIMAVSFQVIPMFHVTPVFPRLWRISLLSLSVFGLVALQTATFLEVDLYYPSLINVVVAIGYAAAGLNRLSLRKRKLPDVVIDYWKAGFFFLVVGNSLILLLPFVSVAWQIKLEVFVGLILGLGFILGIIQGMLLKIVPFLISLHLQPIALKYPQAMMLLPDHYSLISRKHGKIQFWLYLAVMFTTIFSLFIPVATFTIGAALLLNWLWIGFNISKASYTYVHVKNQMLSFEESPEQNLS